MKFLLAVVIVVAFSAIGAWVLDRVLRKDNR